MYLIDVIQPDYTPRKLITETIARITVKNQNV